MKALTARPRGVSPSITVTIVTPVTNCRWTALTSSASGGRSFVNMLDPLQRQHPQRAQHRGGIPGRPGLDHLLALEPGERGAFEGHHATRGRDASVDAAVRARTVPADRDVVAIDEDLVDGRACVRKPPAGLADELLECRQPMCARGAARAADVLRGEHIVESFEPAVVPRGGPHPLDAHLAILEAVHQG